MASMKSCTAECAEELLNHHVLVERCMGNLDLARRLLTRYADTGRDDCDQLHTALEAGDLSSVASVAHRLKGSSATIGSSRMTELASQIEKESKLMNLNSLQSIVAEICEVQNEVRAECLKTVNKYQELSLNGGGE